MKVQITLDPETMSLLRNHSREQGRMLAMLERIMFDTKAVVDGIARLKKDNADLIGAFVSIRNGNKDLAAQLKDALEKLAAMPQDTTEVEAILSSVATDLGKLADDSEAAMADNAAVPDMPAPPAG